MIKVNVSNSVHVQTKKLSYLNRQSLLLTSKRVNLKNEIIPHKNLLDPCPRTSMESKRSRPGANPSQINKRPFYVSNRTLHKILFYFDSPECSQNFLHSNLFDLRDPLITMPNPERRSVSRLVGWTKSSHTSRRISINDWILRSSLPSNYRSFRRRINRVNYILWNVLCNVMKTIASYVYNVKYCIWCTRLFKWTHT